MPTRTSDRRRRREEPRPLIEQAEGADADELSDLVAAFNRLSGQGRRLVVTDLHVRELLRAVYAVGKGPSGVQWSHQEIASRLVCEVATARRVIERAATEFGLLEVIEQRYVTGGQSANRYKINWQMVRSVNAGKVHRRDIGKSATEEPTQEGPGALREQPPALSAHGGALREQGAALREHPYKETSSISNSISSSTHSLTPRVTTNRPDVNLPTGGWEVVVSALEERLMDDARNAANLAALRGLTAEDVLDLIERWDGQQATHPKKVNIGWLHRWMTGLSRPKAAYDPPSAQPKAKAPSRPSNRDAAERMRIRCLKEYKAVHGKGFLDDPEVLPLIAQRLVAAGLVDQMTPAERACVELELELST